MITNLWLTQMWSRLAILLWLEQHAAGIFNALLQVRQLSAALEVEDFSVRDPHPIADV
jgi:hypothetical protein